MEFRGSGLTVWYDTPDAPAPPGTVSSGLSVTLTVGVTPAHPSNTVEVRYRVDGGPELALRARLLRTEYAGSRQYFQAAFPYIAPQSTVDYGPVACCSGRRAGVSPSGPLPSSFVVAPDSSRSSGALPPDPEQATKQHFPRSMEFLTRCQVQLASQPEVIGDTPDGLHLNFPLAGGVAQGPRLNGTVRHFGGDWMRVRTDGVGIPDIHATIAATDGALIMLHSTGRFDLGPNGYANANKNIFPPSPPLVLSIEFLTAHSAYDWLNRTQCVGIGYVQMAELRVHYDVYGILSLSS